MSIRFGSLFWSFALVTSLGSSGVARAAEPATKAKPSSVSKPAPRAVKVGSSTSALDQVSLNARLQPSIDPVENLGGVDWVSQDLKVILTQKPEGKVPVVIIRGALNRQGWGLFYKGKWLVKIQDPQRDFSVRLELTGERTHVVLGAIGPQNKKGKVGFDVIYSDFEKATGGVGAVGRGSRFKGSIGLGPTLISYNETTGTLATGDLKMFSITAKGSIRYELIQKKLDLGLSAYFTALQLTTTYTDPTVAARFLGVNVRIGYTFPASSNFVFALHGGWYYTTMLVTGKVFGFTNMAGPQLFPTGTFLLGGGKTLGFYAKFSPIVGLSFSNREIAGGVNFGLPLGNGHPLLFAVDVADLKFNVSTITDETAGTSVTTAVSSKSYSFSLGYGF